MSALSVECLYGINTVYDLLKHSAKSVTAVYVDASRTDKRMTALIDQAQRSGITVQRCARSEFAQLLQQTDLDNDDTNHQGVIAQYKPQPAKDEDYLASLIRRAESPLLLLILDSVTDPHNLGACLRSANAAAANAVIVPKDKAVGLTPVVRKVASGAAETTPLVVVKNLARCIKALQDAGVWVMGAAGEAEQSLYDLDLRTHVAIVMGSEGSGLRRLTRERCDQLFSIPMQGSVESLNVSVAAGICLYEGLRQRQ